MAAPLESVRELRAALDADRTSARELAERALARAEALEPRVHALLGTRPEAARAEADAADARRARGERLSPLDGIPVALKDNLAQEGEPLGCASRILAGYRSLFDATAVARLRAAGAVVVARTNMDEFAMGSSTENSAAGATRNPWDPGRSPGGSSGGSAAAVAAGIVPLAFGSDTGGSIRQPASLCGVTGLKPTYGRVSRYGLVAFASSLDQIGPLARDAHDCALALDVVAGHDPADATSLPEAAPACAAELSGEVSDLVLGLPRELFDAEASHPEVLRLVRGAAEELERAGAKLREVSIPSLRYGIAAYYLIATAEASSNLARYDGVRFGRRAEGAEGLTDMMLRSRSEGFGPEVKRRVLLGTYVLSAGYYDAYYRKAQQVRTLLRREIEAAFGSCDLLLGPTAPEPAFPLGERAADPLRMYLSDVHTVAANLAGLPAISVPCGLVSGLPVGLQILGRPLADAAVLRAADAYQRRTAFHEARPPEPA